MHNRSARTRHYSAPPLVLIVPRGAVYGSAVPEVWPAGESVLGEPVVGDSPAGCGPQGPAAGVSPGEEELGASVPQWPLPL